ncbi:acid phosphatase [Ramlibacter tataouinensis]|uniref:Acid phosphatase n=1 Tax=Ramlibacter tataouinensis TaxID=94132 RepID=A0A127JS64_9BURK|nr:phosphatase PAP2 family protein [Ramlibacter tataouinensis]AMO22733.1 acid phosphatase [Ramlibacter tataouinensis]
MPIQNRLLVALAALACLGACSSQLPRPTPASEVPEIRPGVLAGYLPRNALPNSLTLLAAPPASGTAAFAVDEEAYRSTRSLQGSARWKQASEDAVLRFPQAAAAFSCAADLPITEKDTPHTYLLLRRTMADAGLATYAAKDSYKRKRPFATYNEPTCAPAEEASLAKDGSYPSGHSSLGWAWALVLAEIVPERADAILKRGEAYGQSRVICGVHWQSDVDAGRLVAAGVVARVHAEPAFLAEVEAARKEIREARSKKLAPSRDCGAEAQALGTR